MSAIALVSRDPPGKCERQLSVDTIAASALLFDMDGTLVDSAANVDRAYRWWAERHSLAVEPILEVQTGRPHREVMAQFTSGLDLAHESTLFANFEEQDEEGMPLVAGVEDVLRIADQGKWAVVTSAKQTLAAMRFRVTGLRLPKVLITSDIVKHGKPNPECYLMAAEALKVSASECVVFEDATAGVEAARRAGMPVVGVNTSGRLTGTDLLIRNFLELEVSQETGGGFLIRYR